MGFSKGSVTAGCCSSTKREWGGRCDFELRLDLEDKASVKNALAKLGLALSTETGRDPDAHNIQVKFMFISCSVHFRIVLMLAIFLAGSTTVVACSCTRGTIADSLAYSEEVFVGKVASVNQLPARSFERANRDGSVTVVVEESGPEIGVIEVARIFKGSPASKVEFIQAKGNSCTFPFIRGETFLVFASVKEGRYETDRCRGTRLIASASEQLKYLEGIARKQPLAILYGVVLACGANGGTNGASDCIGGSRNPFRNLFVVARSVTTTRTAVFALTSDAFEIVLPPGRYKIWVERNERVTSRIQTVDITHPEATHLALIVE